MRQTSVDRTIILRLYLSFILLIGLYVSAYSQQYFTQNKGQWNSEVLFKKQANGAVLYLKPQSISVLLYNDQQWSELVSHPKHNERKLFKNNTNSNTVDYHHYIMYFENSNNVVPQGEQPSSYVINYFLGNDSTKWASGVRDFGFVRYENLYDNIDLLVYGHGTSLKYDFVLKAGADISQIKIRYDYVDNLDLQGDSLIIKTSLGSFSEKIPISFIEENDYRTEVSVRFTLSENTVQFVSETTPTLNQTMIIDPQVVFATYAGNSVDNFGFTATYDEQGNLYSGGIATAPDFSFNKNGYYPTTVGAFSTTYSGGDEQGIYSFKCDITLNKYSNDGKKLISATYLGGESNEYPHSIVVDKNNELVVFGTTFSDAFPVSANAFQKNNKGLSDLIITRFTADFSNLVGSTYLGGDSKDGLNEEPVLNYFYADNFRGEVQIDKTGNICVSSSTYSDNFPTVSAFQSKIAGRQDGVFVQLKSDLSQLFWSTYLGGNSGDALYSVDFDTAGIIYLSGGTKSSDLTNSTAGIGTKFNGGVCDGFIAMLNPSTKALIKTAYWGTNSYDQIFHLEIDYENKIYVVGQSQGNMPIVGNVYNNPSSGQFISKFDDQLNNLELSTVFGSGNGAIDITINAFLVDECRKIFISGWGGETSQKSFSSTSKLTITPDAYQKTTDGSDFYLVVFSKQAKHLLYATWFGGYKTHDHVDGGTSRFDKKGVIYQSVCASCPMDNFTHAISDFPTTKGAYAEKNVSPRCSNAAFKIAFGNLNRPPYLSNQLFHVKALDTLNFLYSITDVDEDSIFVTLSPDAKTASQLINFKAQSKALEKWQQNIAFTAACGSIGDTLSIKVYAIDQGCPGVLDSSATIKIVVDPPPILDPPQTICLNFVGDDAIIIEWDSISFSKYYQSTTLYRIDPSGKTTKLTTANNIAGGKYQDNNLIKPKQNEYRYFLVVTNKCNVDGPSSYEVSTTKEFLFPIETTYIKTATVTDDDHIQVVWLQTTEADFGYYEILRKRNGDNQAFEYFASTFNREDTFFIDNQANVNEQSYCYVIVVHDKCGHFSKQSNEGCTIVLEGVSVPFKHTIWWNDYTDWPNDVNDYSISRCVDTGQLALYDLVDGTTTTLVDTTWDYCWGGYWYRVTAYENGGLGAESQSNRIYLVQPPLLHVPNAFTPNGDNLNETWGIVPVFVKEYEIEVFNRWGERVYSSENVKEDWAGFYKDLQPGQTVYIYKIRYTGWDRSVHHRTGTVTVIK
ncbi:MAG: gliding motility-associated C-terminal domain-containing protein [Flavobacteriales bacterium]|nr:gliding motility-associated C-terminal domain-containing protein [Flavobacteriales bacterium]